MPIGLDRDPTAPACPLPGNPLPTPALSTLFAAFLRLGVTAFGGPAMVVYIRELAVVRRRWLDEPGFDGGVALCQTVPGATAMQTAAYVGLRVRGFPGALAAYTGFGLPAFALMLALSMLYTRTFHLPLTMALFAGLRAVVVAIVGNAACQFALTTISGWRTALLATAAALLFLTSLSPVLVILPCALAGAWLLLETRPPAGGGTAPHQPTLRPALLLGLAAMAALGLLFGLDRILFQLATVMMRIDLLAFGGGFASIPLMQHELTDARGWLSAATFMDGIALGQVTPGPIVITATFAGYLVHGPTGALVATLAVFLPSFLMVCLLAPHFDALQQHRRFRGATRGALVCFVGLLAAVTLRFALATTWSLPFALLALAAFAALRRATPVHWVLALALPLSLLLA